MPLYSSNFKKQHLYKGYYKPVNLYRGHKKIAGWHNEEQTGDNLTFEGTYNDAADVVVKGNTVIVDGLFYHAEGIITIYNYSWDFPYVVGEDSLQINQTYNTSVSGDILIID